MHNCNFFDFNADGKFTRVIIWMAGTNPLQWRQSGRRGGGSRRSHASAAASTVASLRPENITPSRVVADGQPSQLNGRTSAVTRARYSGVSSSSTSGRSQASVGATSTS